MTLWTGTSHARQADAGQHFDATRLPVLVDTPRRRLALLMMAADFLVAAGAFWAAHLLRDSSLAFQYWGRVSIAAAGAGLLCVPLLGVHGLYDARIVSRGWHQLGLLLRAWLLLMGVTILVIFLVKADSPLRSRLALALFALLGSTAMILARLGGWRTWLTRRLGPTLRGARVIVGRGRLARRVVAAGIGEPGRKPVLVGFVDDVERATPGASEGLPAPFLGGLDRVRRLARERRITEVLVAREDLTRGRLVELAHQWLDEGLQVSLVSSAFEVMVARASGGVMDGVPFVELKRSPQRGWGLKAKRILDVTLVSLGGLVLLPVLGLVALAIRATSRGPILYRQVRVGRMGRPFTLYKFRSMEVNNDDGAHRAYVEALMRGKPAAVDANGDRVYKMVDDPRVTRVGRILRRTSLDELPQLWNVLMGQMSLVGPRPCLPYEWELYEDWQRHRLDVVPGITGLWQVSGRSQVSFEEMVLLDLHYIANWSLGLDLLLLCRTVPVVFSGTGGH